MDLLQHGSPSLIDLLPQALWAKLVEIGRYEDYADGQRVHARGDDKPGISVVVHGRVVAGVQGADGTFLTTSVMGEGQCFGEFTLFAGLPRTHDISAVGETRILQIKGKPFMALFDAEPLLARSLLTVSLYRTHGLLEFLDDLRRLPLPVHLGKFLLSMAEFAQQKNEIRCNHESLAFTFGVSRVSIGKALKKLDALGLIVLGYGKVGVPDESRLREWVDVHCPVAALRASVLGRRGEA
jgi:CRP/FNR family transcriptional regulator, cyclic AMP receptor protein